MRGRVEKEEEEEKMKIRIDDEWRDVTKTTGREIYEQLLRLRYGTHKEEPDRINHAMTSIAKRLTPHERQFWWRVAHRNFMTNNRAHKWKVDRRAEHRMNAMYAEMQLRHGNIWNMTVME